MAAIPIDGTKIANEVKEEVVQEAVEFKNKYGFPPCLDVILVGNDPASKIYVERKAKACQECGIVSIIHKFNEVAQQELENQISILSQNADVHGILVQLPLTKNIKENLVLNKINPLKDVDVLTSENIGLLIQGQPRFLPCTPHGIQVMLKSIGYSTKGKHVVVINRSRIVGVPLSSMLIQDNGEYANATVTVCHNETNQQELANISKSGDVIVVAVGIPDFLKSNMVKKDAVVIDVGINRLESGKIVGDCHKSVWNQASFVSKVPGGCGPLTITMLLKNTVQAAKYCMNHLNFN